MLKLLISSCFVVYVSSFIFAQPSFQRDSVLLEKLQAHSRIHQENILFLHLDKTLYTNNETIWLAGYLVKSEIWPGSHIFLSTALVRDDNRAVALEKKIDMQNGLASGSIDLPDSLAPGSYHLIAYTNILGADKKPIAFFTQPLTIKSITEADFSASLSLMDKDPVNGVIRATLQLTLSDTKSKIKPVVTYTIDNKTVKTLSLDRQYTGTITIAQKEIEQIQHSPVLYATVYYNGKHEHLSIALPALQKPAINVSFFPEGGSLVRGIASAVGWEAMDERGQPIAIKGVLYKNNSPVDTISTNTYGVGKFLLKPESNNSYSVHIASGNWLQKDTAIQITNVLSGGTVLKLANAVVNDTLRMELFSSAVKSVRVLIHNYRDAYADFEMVAKPGGIRAAVALNALPKGLATVTILDEQGWPLAERLFFAHYDKKINVIVSTDKQEYGKKEKVSIKLKLTDELGNPVKGVVSVACVQGNRIENHHRQDIEEYAYLTHELSSLPINAGRAMEHTNYLEDVMLVKGWRRYNWRDMLITTQVDTLKKNTIPVIKGQVKLFDKPVKKPVEVTVFRSISSLEVIPTDKQGQFTLSKEQLLADNGSFVSLSVNEKRKEGYSIIIDDPYTIINKNIAGHIDLTEKLPLRTVQNTGDWKLKGLEHAVTLQEVVVKSKNNNSIFGAKPKGSNECGDFVNRAGYLNPVGWEQAIGNYPPVKGQRYIDGTRYRRRSDGAIISVYELSGPTSVDVLFVIYEGCKTNKTDMTKIPGIYAAKEFYGIELVKNSSTNFSQYASTLLWRAGVLINENNESEYEFCTGDITGAFKIVLQGVGEKDILYGENNFNVK